MSAFQVRGQWVDIPSRRISPALLSVQDGRIAQIEPTETVQAADGYLLPGFVDAHIHVESSLLPPAEFSRWAVIHGTVATVSDPHEIANVLGVEGVRYMIDDHRGSPLKIRFGAPSCVPATAFETAGAALSAEQVGALLRDPEIGYLAEVMNYPGVLAREPVFLSMIEQARAAGKPVDGHAPGLRGSQAQAYAAVGITTDHECFTLEEAQDKLAAGMKILIREGSAARNFQALVSLLRTDPDRTMLCSDDLHPDLLMSGHINRLASRAVAEGVDLFHVLQAACLNPVDHYRLPVGRLRKGDPADFIRVRDLDSFTVLETYIDGVKVAENGRTLVPRRPSSVRNAFAARTVEVADVAVPHQGKEMVRVIEAFNGQLVTGSRVEKLAHHRGFWIADPNRDILKIVVLNRYQAAIPAVGFITGFGLKQGAIASTVAHDSHNLVAVGADDASLVEAINGLVETKGGLSVVGPQGAKILPLPIAGLMSDQPGDQVAARYTELDEAAKALGSKLDAPFMTLSFMALLVIPSLKMSDLGLFDGKFFGFAPLEV
jgi:adenine deaminase